MPTPQPAHTFARVYAEARAGYEDSLRLFMLAAASHGRAANATRGGRLCAARRALAETHEILAAFGEEEGPPGVTTPFPFSPEGLAFYRERFGLTEAQWRGLVEFLSGPGRPAADEARGLARAGGGGERVDAE